MTLTFLAFVAAIVTVSRQNFTDIVFFFTHYVHVHKSELSPILRGVPQGSIFGPLFFMLMICLLCRLKFILFADDTNIFHSRGHSPDLVSEINTELNKVSKWFCVNKLPLNIIKTYYILFGRYSHQQNVAIIYAILI